MPLSPCPGLLEPGLLFPLSGVGAGVGGGVVLLLGVSVELLPELLPPGVVLLPFPLSVGLLVAGALVVEVLPLFKFWAPLFSMVPILSVVPVP